MKLIAVIALVSLAVSANAASLRANGQPLTAAAAERRAAAHAAAMAARQAAFAQAAKHREAAAAEAARQAAAHAAAMAARQAAAAMAAQAAHPPIPEVPARSDQICAEETIAVTTAQANVLEKQNTLNDKNDAYAALMKQCNSYHFKEIQEHPECGKENSPEAQAVQTAQSAVTAAKAAMSSAQDALDACDKTAYTREQDEEDEYKGSNAYTEDMQAEHERSQQAAANAREKEDKMADADKNAANAVRRGAANSLTDLLAEIEKQLATERKAVMTQYGVDVDAFTAARKANELNALEVRDTQIHALETQIEFRMRELNAAEANHRVAHQELVAATKLRDQMHIAAKFARETAASEFASALTVKSECMANAEQSEARQVRAANAQKRINDEFFADQLGFVQKIREFVGDLQSGTGEDASSKFDNAAEAQRRAAANAADAQAEQDREAAQAATNEQARLDREATEEAIKNIRATFGNPPTEPVTMPLSNCPETSGNSNVCYFTHTATEYALYTFSSDCEAEYARDHANTDATFDENAEEGGQAEKSTTNELYSTLLKNHDGSCAEIDTATDSLVHEYELTQEAGQAASESVAAREEDEMSFRDGFALMSLKQRIRLTSLVHKYVSVSRAVDQDAAIAQVLASITDRINSEQLKATAAHDEDIKRFATQRDGEEETCGNNYDATKITFTDLVTAAEEKEGASLAKFERKELKEKAAKGALDAAIHLKNEADAQMARQEPVIQAAYDTRMTNAEEAYNDDLSLAQAKRDRDLKYIAEEETIIKTVKKIVDEQIGTVQTQTGTGNLNAKATSSVAEDLISMAERITSKRVYRIAQAARLSRRRRAPEDYTSYSNDQYYNINADRANEKNRNQAQSSAEAGRLSESSSTYTSKLAERGVTDSDTTKNLGDEAVNNLDDFEAQERYDDTVSGQREGQNAYTQYNFREGDQMEEIRKMLGELDQQLDVELTQVNTRKINNEKIANDNADKLVKRADDVLRMKKEALASLVDVAQKNYNDAETKKDVAKSALDTAQSRFTSASATFAAVSKTSVEDIGRYDSEKESCESNAATIRDKDLARILKQKEEALGYLENEQEVVRQIRELLKDLNLDFKFTDMGEESYATSLVQMRSGKKQMLTGKQKAAIRTLVTLAGKLDPNQYIDSSKHSAKESIGQLLNNVEDTLKSEVASVNSQYEADKVTVGEEHDAQVARCGSIHTHQVSESKRRVAEAEAAKQHAQGAVNSAEAAAGDANEDYNAKKEELEARKDQKKEGEAIAITAHSEDTTNANAERERRLKAIGAEAKADTIYLEANKKAISDIREFLGEASALLQVAKSHKAGMYAATGEMGTYITHSSASAKERIDALLTKIESHIGSELDRVNEEHEADTRRLQEEREAQDEEATFFKDDDLKKLADVRRHAEEEKAEADKDLAAATADHMEKSKTHNYNMDTLETAKQIQITNLPMFTRDRDQTLEEATYVFQQEEEIINAKRHQADYYLQTEEETLNEIEGMLSRVNVLHATPNKFAKTTNGFDEASESGHSAGIWNLAHNAQTWNAINEEEATRARETGFTYDDHERSDVDDHVLTNFRGEKVKFDDAGELKSEPETDFVSEADLDVNAKSTTSKVDEKMINDEAREALEGRAEAARGALLQIASRHGLHASGETVGDYLVAVQQEVEREMSRVEDDHVSETERITSMRDMLHKKANDIFKKETDEDQARVDAADIAAQTSLEALEKAHAKKVEATKVAIQKAAILRDAIATQNEQTPKIMKMFNDRMAANKAAHEKAQASIDASKQDAEEYLNKELQVIAEVRPIIEGMDSSGVSAELLQVVHKVVRRTLQRIASKRYDFNVRRSADYVDRQEEQYMSNGDQGKQGDKYKKVFTGEGGINSVIDGLRKELQAEIANVARAHAEEMAELKQTRQSTIAEALKTKRDEKEKLTKALNAAVEKHHVTSHDLSQQQDIYDKADIFQGEKAQEETDAKKAQEINFREQSDILSTKQSAANNAYTTETTEFKRIMDSTTTLIKNQFASLEQIRDYTNGKLANGPAAEAAVNRCEDEMRQLNSAKAEAAQKKQACAVDRIREQGGEEALRDDASRAACGEAAAADARLDSATIAYNKCIEKETGSAAFITVKSMHRTLSQLRKKYIDREGEAQKAGDVNTLNSLLNQIEAKIKEEEKEAKATFEKDMADSKEKRDTELNRAQKRFDDEKKHHEDLVAEATSRRKAADAKLAAEDQVLTAKRNADDAAAAAQDAAQDAVNTRFPIIEAQAEESVQAANQRFLNQKTRIDAIKASDTEYLNDEIETVNEVQTILAKLNARGGGTTE